MTTHHGKLASLYGWNGNNAALTSEPCTISDPWAQITDSAKRIIDPNEIITFTDTGGKNVIEINYIEGKAKFDGTPTSVTATGKYVAAANITEIGNAYNWTLETSVDLVEVTAFGDTSKKWEAGAPQWGGSAERYFLNSYWKDAFDLVKKWLVRFRVTSTKYFTGWCDIQGLSYPVPLNEVVKETITFQGMLNLVPTIP